MKRLAVFCGSSIGASKEYQEGAIQLGKELAKRDITLVYGGASVGMMGDLADATLAGGGDVIGVIPKMLEDREIAHPDLTRLFVVESMHERKAKMAELADGFIALPGGSGTLEEFLEIITWAQLGLHQKPCGLLNIKEYYNPLISLFHHMADQQFLHEQYRSMAFVDARPGQLIDQFHNYQPPGVKSFGGERQT